MGDDVDDGDDASTQSGVHADWTRPSYIFYVIVVRCQSLSDTYLFICVFEDLASREVLIETRRKRRTVFATPRFKKNWITLLARWPSRSPVYGTA